MFGRRPLAAARVRRRWRRKLSAPKVSIHIPAYREPPEMLKQTLDAVARLEYPNFECIVIINNTPDPAFWRADRGALPHAWRALQVRQCRQLDGYKAGALRLALTTPPPTPRSSACIDADYVVQPNWLKDLVPLFADPQVGMIQAPQDHRDGDRSVMHHAMNGEYAGFFDIGMVQRNEANAIIVHGTMCLIRRAALEAAGGWSSDTICEDTDLGLTILERGWQAHYTNKRYGHGLLPDTFEAYKKQRHRWAYGGLQILQEALAPLAAGRAARLTREQKREFALGWLNWLGAESIGVVVAILNLIWVPVVAFLDIAIPDKILTVPIIAAFVVSVAAFRDALPAARAIPAGQLIARCLPPCRCSGRSRARSASAVKDHLPFVRTAKGGTTPQGPRFPGVLGGGAGGALLIARRLRS